MAALGKVICGSSMILQPEKDLPHINPDRIIDLEKEDPRFKGHKIESVCILKETRRDLELVLAADDDKGQTLLFRMVVKK